MDKRFLLVGFLGAVVLLALVAAFRNPVPAGPDSKDPGSSTSASASSSTGAPSEGSYTDSTGNPPSDGGSTTTPPPGSSGSPTVGPSDSTGSSSSSSGSSTQPADGIEFAVVESQDRLKVTGLTGQPSWANVRVSVSACAQAGDDAIGRVGTASPFQNDEASLIGGPLNQQIEGPSCGAPRRVQVGDGEQPVAVDDFLEFCSSPLLADMTQVTVMLEWTTERGTIGSFTFTNWSDC